VIYYQCTNCNYRITSIEMARVRYDYKCPRCHRVNLSYFRLIEINEDDEVEITRGIMRGLGNGT